MAQVQKKKKEQRAKLIFNPNAGIKRRLISYAKSTTTLEEIKELLEQYQIPTDFFPTKGPGHATILAKEAIVEGYEKVIVAGGDGTVGEVANGLIGSNMPLGILPLGSVMNVARMLAIPVELEKAVCLIKIGRSRKIDVGCVTRLNGEKLESPYHFIESCGLGLEAEVQQKILEWERGDKVAFFKIFKTFFEYYRYRAKITLNDKDEIQTRATLVTVANGPYTGAAIPLTPLAKLNDHRLTVSLFRMSKLELLRHILHLVRSGKKYSPKVKTYQAKKVKIETRIPRLVHADARVYGTTPVTFSVIPSALNVITGFPKVGESSLVSRTLLDP